MKRSTVSSYFLLDIPDVSVGAGLWALVSEIVGSRDSLVRTELTSDCEDPYAESLVTFPARGCDTVSDDSDMRTELTADCEDPYPESAVKFSLV